MIEICYWYNVNNSTDSKGDSPMSKKKHSFYLLDFLKNIAKIRNIPIILYLLVDSVFIFLALTIVGSVICEAQGADFNQFFPWCIALSVIIYVGAIALSLSAFGEEFLRRKSNCQPLSDPYIRGRIEPLFTEIYKKAKTESPELSDDIELYIRDDAEPNACAMGRRTVCITTGLLSYTDDQIRAVLSHEFGHLAHKDTDLLLVMNVANSFIHWFFLFVWIILIVIKVIEIIVTFFVKIITGSKTSILGVVFNAIFTAIMFGTVKLVEKLWNVIGNIFLMMSARGSEFRADLYAKKLGYGNELIEFFNTLPDAQIGKRTKGKLLFSKLTTLGHSHPATWRRIDNLNTRNL